jgi:hypothetical protein
MFNVESLGELERINEIDQGMGKRPHLPAHHPDVGPQEPPLHIQGLMKNKFAGHGPSLAAYARAKELAAVERWAGTATSGQLTNMDPFLRLDKVMAFTPSSGTWACHRYWTWAAAGHPVRRGEPPTPPVRPALVERTRDSDLTWSWSGRVSWGNAESW